MNECLFCKIAHKQTPSDIFFEDERVVAFLDIHPHSKGHSLVIPKEHSENIFHMSETETGAFMASVFKISKFVVDALGANAANVATNIGREAGQVIFHTHIHIIPRFDDSHSHAYKYKEGEKETTLKALRDRAGFR